MTDQQWNAAEYVNHAGFVPALGAPVLELLAPAPGERILDLGCGEGALTQEIAGRGCDVLGVDSSVEMVAATQARGLPARQVDGHALDFTEEFDAVFSNAALHWMREPARVVQGVFRALKPAGRFVGEFGGQGNVALLLDAVGQAFDAHPALGQFVCPWYFPSPDEYRVVLARAGFRVPYIELIPRPTPLESGIIPWLRLFVAGMVAGLTPAQREGFYAEVARLARPRLYREDAGWFADYVRLRFVALKA